MPSTNPSGTRHRAAVAEKSLSMRCFQALKRRVKNRTNAYSLEILGVLRMCGTVRLAGGGEHEVRGIERPVPLGRIAGVIGIEDCHDRRADCSRQMERPCVSANQQFGLPRQRNELKERGWKPLRPWCSRSSDDFLRQNFFFL